MLVLSSVTLVALFTWRFSRRKPHVVAQAAPDVDWNTSRPATCRAIARRVAKNKEEAFDEKLAVHSNHCG
jgi:hypothetical protein